jgi:hypothetical protein
MAAAGFTENSCHRRRRVVRRRHHIHYGRPQPSLDRNAQHYSVNPPPAPVVAKSAEDAIDGLFDELVVDPAGRQFRFAKKNEAVGSTRRAYRQAHLSTDSVAEKVVVHAGPYEQTFDFVVHNGEVVQLVQCWSFQLPNQDDLAQQVKAWAWAVREIRDSKDSATAGEDLTVRDGADVDVPL